MANIKYTAEQINALFKKVLGLRIDDAIDENSTNPVQNNVIKKEFDNIRQLIEQGDGGFDNYNYGVGDTSSHKFYSFYNFAAGSNNSVGTCGFDIVSYYGTEGGVGTYVLRGSSDNITKLTEALSINTDDSGASNLKYSVINSMNCDYFGNITDVALIDEINIAITVDNFYSNSANEGEQIPEYSSEVVYESVGVRFKYAPVLGYSIQQRENAPNGEWYDQACVYICGYPELGTKPLYGYQTSFGEENINQAEYSFTSGSKNKNYGKYGAIFGKENVGGFGNFIHGRWNNSGYAQECNQFGRNNLINSFVTGVFQAGRNLKSSFNFQFQYGMFNRNKSVNVVEIGNGSNEDDRKNLFEVDKNGLISANEKYLPGQLVLNKTVDLNKVANLITNKENQTYLTTYKLEPIEYGEEYTCTSRFYLYLAIPKSVLGSDNRKYCIISDIDISGEGVSTTNVRGMSATENMASQKYIEYDYLHLNEGKNYLFTPITITDEYDCFGFYLDKINSSSSVTIKVNDVRVYPLITVAEEFNTASLLDDPYTIYPYKNIGGQVTYIDSIFKELPDRKYILYKDTQGGILSVIPFEDNISSEIQLYSTNEYLSKLKTSINEHAKDKKNPHGLSASQVGAYTIDETDEAIKEALEGLDKPIKVIVGSEIDNAENISDGNICFFRNNLEETYEKAPFDTAVIFTQKPVEINEDGYYVQIAIADTGLTYGRVWLSNGIPDDMPIEMREILEWNLPYDKRIFEYDTFELTDFEFESSELDAVYVDDTILRIAGTSEPVTMRCAGKNIGFACSVSGYSDAHITVNGKKYTVGQYGDSGGAEEIGTFVLPPTFMESDIKFDGGMNEWHFVTDAGTNAGTMYKMRGNTEDIEKALDGIIAIQNELIGGDDE